MSKITEKVFSLAKPVVEDEGCSLWDVEYVREAGSWYLRVYIDKEAASGSTTVSGSAGAWTPFWTRRTRSPTVMCLRWDLPARSGS